MEIDQRNFTQEKIQSQRNLKNQFTTVTPLNRNFAIALKIFKYSSVIFLMLFGVFFLLHTQTDTVAFKGDAELFWPAWVGGASLYIWMFLSGLQGAIRKRKEGGTKEGLLKDIIFTIFTLVIFSLALAIVGFLLALSGTVS